MAIVDTLAIVDNKQFRANMGKERERIESGGLPARVVYFLLLVPVTLAFYAFFLQVTLFPQRNLVPCYVYDSCCLDILSAVSFIFRNFQSGVVSVCVFGYNIFDLPLFFSQTCTLAIFSCGYSLLFGQQSFRHY